MATSRNQNNQTVDFSFQENWENRNTVNRSEGIVLVVSLLGPWVHLRVQWVQLAHAGDGAFGVVDLVTFLDVVTVVVWDFLSEKSPHGVVRTQQPRNTWEPRVVRILHITNYIVLLFSEE